jgi:hypothetical protein
MDTRRSYYLAHRQDDFAEAPASAGGLVSYEILYATPANDNSPIKARLWVRSRSFFWHLIALMARWADGRSISNPTRRIVAQYGSNTIPI